MLLPAMAAPVGAADAITLEARALVGGRFEANGWIGIAATLSNGGSPVTGYLAADGEDGTVRRFVELPAGRAQAGHHLPAARRRSCARSRCASNRPRAKSLATASAEARVLERTSGHVAIVGDGGGNLRPQLIARGGGFPEPIPLTPADLPERPEPLRGIETIVWAADSSGLTEAQRRSLERWVAAGGQLVVLGGPDWQARTAAFGCAAAGRAPRLERRQQRRHAGRLGRRRPAGWRRPADRGGRATCGRVPSPWCATPPARPSSRQSVVEPDASASWGSTWPPSRSAPGPARPPSGRGSIPDDRIFEQWGGGAGRLDDEVANAMSVALSNLPSLAVPPAELLLAVIVGYILLIGPLSYLVLRRLDRRELAWIVAPVLVLVFSAVSYGIGAVDEGQPDHRQRDRGGAHLDRRHGRIGLDLCRHLRARPARATT